MIDGIDGLCAALSINALGGIIVLTQFSSYTVSISLVLYFVVALIAFMIVNLGLLKKYINKDPKSLGGFPIVPP